MEFEPFHSDNEDDNLSFMPEKKKKDGMVTFLNSIMF